MTLPFVVIGIIYFISIITCAVEYNSKNGKNRIYRQTLQVLIVLLLSCLVLVLFHINLELMKKVNNKCPEMIQVTEPLYKIK